MIFGNLNKKGGFGGFDSTGDDLQQSIDGLSGTEARAAQSLMEHVREQGLHVVAALTEAVSGGNLDDGELPTDCLDGLMLEAVDNLGSEDDDTVWNMLTGAMSDALESLGVDESMIAEMFGDDIEAADAAIEAASDIVLANLPDDGEPLDEFVREFIYGDMDGDMGDDSDGDFDSAVPKPVNKINIAANKTKRGHVRSSIGKKHVGIGSMHVRTNKHGQKFTYVGAWAIRKGKRVVVHKRIHGPKMVLSASQKNALKKARLKAHTANAMKMRVKSFKKGVKLGLHRSQYK